MTVLTQEALDESQRGLRYLIDMTGKAQAECCERGLTEQRDRLRRTQAYLMLAEAEAGPLSIPTDDGTIGTRSGGGK